MRRIAVAFTVGVLIFAACGGDTDSVDTEGTTALPSSTSSTTVSAPSTEDGAASVSTTGVDAPMCAGDPLPADVAASEVASGDVDGDGAVDTATIYALMAPESPIDEQPWVLHVQFAAGGSAVAPMGSMRMWPRVGAVDLNGDGRSEVLATTELHQNGTSEVVGVWYLDGCELLDVDRAAIDVGGTASSRFGAACVDGDADGRTDELVRFVATETGDAGMFEVLETTARLEEGTMVPIAERTFRVEIGGTDLALGRIDCPGSVWTAPSAVSSGTTQVFRVSEPSILPPDPLPGSAGASGSGCGPGGDVLPDGVWYGRIVQKSGDGLRFDLACFYHGDIAYVEGAADGVEVDNDFYTRNASEKLRTVPVDPSATIYLLEPDQSFAAVSNDSWSGPADGGRTMWLYVNAGRVTEAQDQYTP